MGNNTPALFFKIFFGVALSYLFYYFVIIESDYNIKKLFELYLKGCYIVAIIGIIQLIGFKLQIPFLYDYRWVLNKWGLAPGGSFGIRINSIFPEPTYFATLISSSVFIAIYNLIVRQYYYTRVQSIVVIIGYFISFSGMGYFGILLCFLLLAINFGFMRAVMVIVPVTFVAFSYFYNNVDEFRSRIDGMVEVFDTDKFNVGKTHGSAIVLYNNYNVATKNFAHHFLGTSLGSHPVAFEKYSVTKNVKTFGFANNSLDANSMFLRLLSETGVFGVVIFIFILFKFYVRRNIDSDEDETYWLVSNAICVMIILNLARQGHYFMSGFPFFMLLYIFNREEYKQKYIEPIELEKIDA